MGIARMLRHMMSTRWSARRAFPPATLAAIEKTVRESEAVHAAEIRFVVEGGLDGAPLLRGETARERAIELFSLLRVWDTENNSGVLIYVLLADRRIEIVADRGIHAKVGAEPWAALCQRMEAAFREGRFEQGAIDGIQAVAQLIERRMAGEVPHRNELPDRPVVLPDGRSWR
jgi:uncharacterized membrane protein